jgi:hypothetical protein
VWVSHDTGLRRRLAAAFSLGLDRGAALRAAKALVTVSPAPGARGRAFWTILGARVVHAGLGDSGEEDVHGGAGRQNDGAHGLLVKFARDPENVGAA